MERHLTATGFVVDAGRVLLHWHQKNQLWLPFGGHFEPNEDPVQTVLREIEEESGLRSELLTPPVTFGVTNLPVVAPPVIILVEPTTDGTTAHEHVDLIYFCRPVGTLDALLVGADPTIRWVSMEELERNQPVAPMPGLAAAAIPEDVRLLALSAIRQEAGISSSRRQYQ